MSYAVNGAHKGIAGGDPADLCEIVSKDPQQLREVWGLPFTGHIALGQANIARGHNAAHEAKIMDQQASIGTWFPAFQPMLSPIRQDENQNPRVPISGEQ